MLHSIGVLASATNIRLVWTGLPEADTLAYSFPSSVTRKKFFLTLASEVHYGREIWSKLDTFTLWKKFGNTIKWPVLPTEINTPFQNQAGYSRKHLKMEFPIPLCQKWFSKIFHLGEISRNNPMQSLVMAAIHSITTKLQARGHSGRLFNSLWTTTLQTFIQWPQASAL